MQWVTVTGSKRKKYAQDVWDMTYESYRQIGLKIGKVSDLLEYPVWKLSLDGDKPIAFTVFSSTPYGLKSGLGGSDGTPEGKRAFVKSLVDRAKDRGCYQEVSHKVKDIMLSAGVPVVCSAYAGKILNRDIRPLPDGLHYERTLAGVGVVTKILVGYPKGIPTTKFSDPSCPVNQTKNSGLWIPDPPNLSDWHSHLSCIFG